MKKSQQNKAEKRRTFLKQASAFSALSLVVGSGLSFSYLLGKKSTNLLRPPGAVEEDKFMALCIKCGQCLQVCPYDSIRLNTMQEGSLIGTPFINPLRRGCYLCELLPCVLACPSGALDHHIDSVREVHMGVAKVVRLGRCLALENKPVDKTAIKRAYLHSHTLSNKETDDLSIDPQIPSSEKRELEIEVLEKIEKLKNKSCEICVQMCPFPDRSKAIVLVGEKNGKKPVIQGECVGCGVCVELCPEGVLSIEPREEFEDIK